MKPEDDKEAEPGKSWPPSIPRSGTGKAIRLVNDRKPGTWAWAVIWALAAGRTLLFWAYFSYAFAAEEMPHSDTSAIETFGKTAFPEIAVIAFINDHYHPADSVIFWILTALVFVCTFVVAYLFRVLVVAAWLRYQSQAAKEGEARDEVRK